MSTKRTDVKPKKHPIAKSKRRLSCLYDKAHKQGLCVRMVPQKKLHDYIGMNDLAAKAIGFPSPKKTIMIRKTCTLATKANTLKHELDERGKMAKGKKYWPAHVFALRHER